jgi:putative nucleotidyltransferase with HDIG domain
MNKDPTRDLDLTRKTIKALSNKDIPPGEIALVCYLRRDDVPSTARRAALYQRTEGLINQNPERDRDWKRLSLHIISDGLPKELWRQASEYAFSYLEQGRPDFDVNHTKAVVSWAYQLANNHNQQPGVKPVSVKVLVTAALFHDIGYHGEFNDDPDLQAISDKKKHHMIAGARMAKKFFKQEKDHSFTDEQINQISYLISIHDNLEQIAEEASPEARILMEADTLGAIDVEWVHPTFKGKQALKYLNRDRTIARYVLFETPLALVYLPERRREYIKFIQKRDEVIYDGPTLEELMRAQRIHRTQC